MGLGVWVAQDSSQLAWNSNPGEFGWGGVANTVFWIDPVSDSSVLFFTLDGFSQHIAELEPVGSG